MQYSKELIAHKLRRWEKYLRDYTLPTWDELPRLELYMDQVIALLDDYLDFFPKVENGERVVTATAINNYVRLKIMPAPVKKKYSRLHIAYLIMICSLKRVFTISYVQKMIPMGLPESEVKELYNNYVQIHKKIALYFIDQVRTTARPILHAEVEEQLSVDNLVTMAAVAAGFSELLAQKILNLQDCDLETGVAMESMPPVTAEQPEVKEKHPKRAAKPKEEKETGKKKKKSEDKTEND